VNHGPSLVFPPSSQTAPNKKDANPAPTHGIVAGTCAIRISKAISHHVREALNLHSPTIRVVLEIKEIMRNHPWYPPPANKRENPCFLASSRGSSPTKTRQTHRADVPPPTVPTHQGRPSQGPSPALLSTARHTPSPGPGCGASSPPPSSRTAGTGPSRWRWRFP
jgi:hypothetical protein